MCIRDRYRILPKSLLGIPKYGSINIHSSLLPKYRGAAPIQHALLNQEDSTGVSTFLIEPKVDTGKIIDQLIIEIKKDDNYGSLSKKLSEAGADLIESSINKCLHHSSELIEQDNSIATLAPKISKDDLKINWNDKSDIIQAKVRAFSPKPGAFTTINSKRLKIFKAESISNDNNHEIGSIYNVDKNFQSVADTWPSSLNCEMVKKFWNFSTEEDFEVFMELSLIHISEPTRPY